MSQPKLKSVWTVNVSGYKPFTMGGVPMTKKQAMETAKCIWPKAEKVSVS